jgi:KDO2-lipid IV(A) lauroyltransferase
MIVSVFLGLIARLPFPLIYLLSDIVSVILRISYRRHVVYTNLTGTFPGLGSREVRSIQKQFYQNLCDVVFETIKISRLTTDEIARRVSFHDEDEINSFIERGEPALFYTLHYSNWEWINIGTQALKFQCNPVYKPLKNKKFDSIITEIRSSFGSKPIPMKHLLRHVLSVKGAQGIGILGDQSPPKGNKGKLWLKFLDRETAFYQGVVELPSRLKMPVYFTYIERVKRGHYQIHFEKIFEPGENEDVSFFVQQYLKRSEELIRKNPSEWLWTHKRWKYKRDKTEELAKFQ